MPILGFDSVADMFDGGGAGKSDPGNYSWEGTPFAGSGGGGGGDGKKGGLLSGIGSLVGMAFGGPAGAAIGAGLGNLISGGTVGSALKAGAGSFLTGKLGGGAGNALMSVLGGGATPQDAISQMFGGGGGQMNFAGDQGPMAPGQQAGGQQQGPMGGIMNLLTSPLGMAALLKLTEPKNVELLTPEQRRQMDTGERLPDYQGTPAFDYRLGYAKGGFISGPGTGKSDSIPAKIYQDGGPVREARLSDGEFVMTNRAVRGAGNGDRAQGAAEMYRMMNQFERRA
jgi:hypothetical protein